MRQVTIKVGNVYSFLDGDYDRGVVEEVTSYTPKGAEYSRKYQAGRWDGKIKLANLRTHKFPTGLLGAVVKALEAFGHIVTIDDTRKDPCVKQVFTPEDYKLNGYSMEGKREYQAKAVEAALAAKRGILDACTGCHAKGQKVVLFNGKLANVEDIKVGDKLLGPDSTSRTVLSVIKGKGRLVKITPAARRGKPFVVNDEHLLTCITERKKIVDIAVADYEVLSPRKQEDLRMLKAPPIHFRKAINKPLVDPYYLGLLLGACSFYKKYIFGFEVSYANRPRNLIPNLKALGLFNLPDEERFIPQSYLTSSIEDRRKLLAGLIDASHESYGKIGFARGTGSLVVTESLFDQVCFLINSLGIMARDNGVHHLKMESPPLRKIGFCGDLSEIPVNTFLPVATYTKRPHLSYKFTVDEAGEGRYYGFVLDKDQRYLLDDFTVTHNSGKTAMAAAIIQALKLPTLYVVPSVELLHQTYATFEKALQPKPGELGKCGDGTWEPGTWVTIAIADTLDSRQDTTEGKTLLTGVDVLFADETHFSAATTWYNTMMKCTAYYRYGISGTPLDRTDGANLNVIALTGEVFHAVKYKTLVEAQILPKASIIFDRVTTPIINPKCRDWAKVYSEGIVHNPLITEKVVKWAEYAHELGLSCLILVDQIQHGKAIDDALWQVPGKLIPHQFIHGSEKADRPKALLDFEARRLPVLIASRILDTGVSLDSLDVLILASSGKSKIRTLQRLGRALRGERAIVIDFVNTCHKYLAEHSMQRLDDLKAQDCFRIIAASPSKDILLREWELQKRKK
jgi:superfamily II DNA or RNA helicase